MYMYVDDNKRLGLSALAVYFVSLVLVYLFCYIFRLLLLLISNILDPAISPYD